MDIKNYICPVCNETFNEDDDAVFCPECGTPHHRECWKKNGKCFNEALHGTQEIEDTFKNKNTEQEKVINGVEASSSEKTQNQEKPKLPFSVEIKNPDFRINPSQTFLIDGQPSVLYEVAVRKNQRYYLPSFMAISQLNKKTFSWNFWAFLVPFAWSVYRKMYKLSAIFFAIYLLIFSVNVYYVATDEGLTQSMKACAQEDPNYLQNISLYLSGGDVSLTVNQQELIEEISQFSVPGIFSTLSTVVLLGCRVFMGFRANTEYMKVIKKTIKKGEKLGFSGDSLKMYVYRKRGIIPIVIPIIIGLFEWFNIY